MKKKIKKILKKALRLNQRSPKKGGFPVKEESVIFPRKTEKLFNNRMFKYLLCQNNEPCIHRWTVEQRFYNKTKRFPNLDNPTTLNEKMQWMRLYYHDPLMVKCVDKCSFKDYIKETVGEEYVVPLYGVWDNVNDIDFDKLPNKFVIKTTWGWGDLQNIIVRDKTKMDSHKIRAMLSNWLMPWNNYYYQSFEWDSKDIKPRVIAEKYLESEGGAPDDYKFYCYNGECKHFLICKERKIKTKFINYDINFNCIKPSPNSYVTEEPLEVTDQLKKMIQLAEKLSKPFPLVRVDFYDVDGKLYVGELTFSPGGGLNTFYEEWDKKFGEYLKLPAANVNE